jgi:hypothetical protein
LPQARDEQQVIAALRPIEHELLAQAVRLFARGELAPGRGRATADWPTGLRAGRSTNGQRSAGPSEG